MKKRTIIVVVSAVMLAVLCFELLCVCPLPRYCRISTGLSASEIHGILGEPQDSMRELKGVELWIRQGVVLETCFAVSYSDQTHPDRATKLTLWMRKKIISSNKPAAPNAAGATVSRRTALARRR